MTNSLAGQESLFAQDTWCGRTSPEHSAATKDGTSRPCSKKRSASSSRKPPVLKCLQKAGLPGGGYRDVDGRWSVAWRVHDAQYWGVPQRRRRIALVADFGGDTAHEILFERAGVSGDIAESGASGKGFAEAAERGFNPAVRDCLTAWDCQSKRIFDINGKSPTLQGGVGGGVNNPAIFAAIHINDQTIFQGAAYGICSYASNSMMSGNPHSGIYEADTSRTLDGNGGNQVPLTYQDVTGTLSPGAHAGSYNGQDAYNDMLVCGVTPDVSHALRAKANCAYREDAETYPVQNMMVRRLTPLECERLQGFPDGWTDIGDYTDSTGKQRKTSDSARYKALGNSIALPFWRWMFGRMAAYLPEGATLGSLFDGIGGFPLCWEDVHGAGTAVWASEIEEFPIAVTKKRFGSENMIHYTLNIEPPVEPQAYTCPRCPVCGAETDTVYKNVYGDPVGCPECVTEVDAWAE